MARRRLPRAPQPHRPTRPRPNSTASAYSGRRRVIARVFGGHPPRISTITTAPAAPAEGTPSERPHSRAGGRHDAAGRAATFLPATASGGGRGEEEADSMWASAVLCGVSSEVGEEDGRLRASECAGVAADARGAGDGDELRERPGVDGGARAAVPAVAAVRVRVPGGERMERNRATAPAHTHPRPWGPYRGAGAAAVGSELAGGGEGDESRRPDPQRGGVRAVRLQGREGGRRAAPAGLQGEGLHRLTRLPGPKVGRAVEGRAR